MQRVRQGVADKACHHDFLTLLGAWGPCDVGGGCLGDLDGDGQVGITDFLELLGAWGVCT